MLTENAAQLLLVIFIALAAYSSIFISLKNLQQEYQVKQENHAMHAELSLIHI